MSTETGRNGDGPSSPTSITLELSEDGETWIVTDGETGVTTQGDTREHAWRCSTRPSRSTRGEAGEPVTDDLPIGVDPETVLADPGVPDEP